MADTKVERFLKERSMAPLASGHMANSVSQYRREVLQEEVERGMFKERGSSGHSLPRGFENTIKTSLGNIIGSSSFLKTATGVDGTATSGGGYRGSGGTYRQTPEIYSPLWLNSNLNLPRDRATINAWCRAFFALNPVVHNAITLHSTYPISKLNIKCKDAKMEQFFQEMIEETNLMNICVQIAQEYWLLGEAFVYAELDQSTAKWSRFVIQNPDYMVVKHSIIAGEPILSLRPDETLKNIVKSNRPSDVEQRQRLDPSIVEHVYRGENIPLSNFYASHIANRISPYETRGTGLPVSCFRTLMLLDKLRESKFAQADNLINPLTLVKIGGGADNFKPSPEDLEAYRQVFECHDEETEVLTDQGFKKYYDVMEEEMVMDGTTGSFSATRVRPKEKVKIACFNPKNEQLEYHEPTAAHTYDYDGEMHHFHNDKMDIKVTPNHKMWVQAKKFKGTNNDRTWKWGEWSKTEAQDLKHFDRRFRSKINWIGNDDIKTIKVGANDVPIELYLKFLGHILSEGCLYTDGKFQNTVGISQTKIYKNGKSNPNFDDFQKCAQEFSKAIDKSYSEQIFEKDNSTKWTATFCSKWLYDHFVEAVGTENGVKAPAKAMPRWVLDLSPRLLKICLDACVAGDGSDYQRKISKDIHGYFYYSTSQQLANDIFEMVYKAGFVPTMTLRDNDAYIFNNGEGNPRLSYYTIQWSNSNIGEFPLLNKYSTDPRTKEKTEIVSKVNYNGKVWCFTVPTGLFITRRNGKITIQGNSAQYDKDFKIFTHDAVEVVKVGSNGSVIDISGDVTQGLKELYIGLMVPQVLMDGGSDVTYANGGVTLDVLKQRYMQFRNMLSDWLRTKIFAPISKINGFYERVDGEKRLVVPEVEWNHMSLFDAGDYIQNLVQMSSGEKPTCSRQTLYRSLGLSYEDEVRKMHEESIQDVISEKENIALREMTLNELRTLGPDDLIDEPEKKPLPGESDAAGGDLGLGGLPGMPSAPGGGGGGGLDLGDLGGGASPGGDLGGGPPPEAGPPG